MNFFEHQQQARRSGTRLVVLFGLAVLAMIVTIDIVVVGAYRVGYQHQSTPPIDSTSLSDEEMLLAFGATALTLLVILAGSLFRISQLRLGGGAAVAGMMGGRRIEPGTDDPDERRLLNVVEEMAIAAGCNVPAVYLMPEELSINAFAAGYTPSEATIVVSKGCLSLLTRDELQGVVAHEFSHIFNGDMRTNIKMLGILDGILIIGITGAWMLRMLNSDRRSSKAAARVVLAFLAIGVSLWAIGYLGLFFGRLIKSSLSRSREYLADASAVQFTRNPLGIAGALKKIHGGTGAYLASRGTEQLSHFFFADGVGFHVPFFTTHPPLTERLDRILPDWETQLPDAPPPPPAFVERAVAQLNAQRLRESVGTTTAAQIATAHDLIDGIPPTIKKLSQLPQGAETVLFALLAVEHEVLPEEAVKEVMPPDQSLSVLKQAHRQLRESGEANWLPVASLCMPALQQRTPEARASFVDRAKKLIESDQQTSPFEASILALLERSLATQAARHSPPKLTRLIQVREEILSLCAILAHAGTENPAQAERAFQRGVGRATLNDEPVVPPRTSPAMLPHLLKSLAGASPKMKETILDALTEVAVSDGSITLKESELLRTVAGALECPMPLLPPTAA